MGASATNSTAPSGGGHSNVNSNGGNNNDNGDPQQQHNPGARPSTFSLLASAFGATAATRDKKLPTAGSAPPAQAPIPTSPEAPPAVYLGGVFGADLRSRSADISAGISAGSARNKANSDYGLGGHGASHETTVASLEPNRPQRAQPATWTTSDRNTGTRFLSDYDMLLTVTTTTSANSTSATSTSDAGPLATTSPAPPSPASPLASPTSSSIPAAAAAALICRLRRSDASDGGVMAGQALPAIDQNEDDGCNDADAADDNNNQLPARGQQQRAEEEDMSQFLAASSQRSSSLRSSFGPNLSMGTSQTTGYETSKAPPPPSSTQRYPPTPSYPSRHAHRGTDSPHSPQEKHTHTRTLI